MRLHFVARLFDQAFDLFLGQSRRKDTRPRLFPSAEKQILFRIDRDRYSIFGTNAPTGKLSRNLPGSAFYNFNPFSHRRISSL
jgi:hypothetical protein